MAVDRLDTSVLKDEAAISKKEKRKHHKQRDTVAEDGHKRRKTDKETHSDAVVSPETTHGKERKRKGVDKPVTEAESDEKKKKKHRKHREADEEAVIGETKQYAKQDEKKEEKREKKTSLKAEEEAINGEAKQHADLDEKKEKKREKKRKRKADESELIAEAASESTKASKREKRKEWVDGQSDEARQPFHQSTQLPVVSDIEVSQYLSKHGISIDTDLPNNLKPVLSFSSVLPHIPEKLHGAFKSFNEPTPIQACSWPALLDGRDVVGIAETGSGKTLAFGIPAISRIVKDRDSMPSKKKSKSKHGDSQRIAVLAVAPTRELALQTHDTFTELGKLFSLTSVALYGGVDKTPQRHALSEEGAAMVVGTPGRILDLVNEGACDLSGVTYLVLDEADRMLDKGFENDIRAIIGHCAPSDQRQTLMFSATWPDAVRKLAATFQSNPVRITVGSDDLTANRRVEQVVEVFDDPREKDSRLTSHLRKLKARKGDKTSEDESRILVFVLYKKEATRVEQYLQRQGFSVGGIHGDLSQSARIAALDDFKTGKKQLLVATDVAARGLDIPNVGTVINYSFPLTVEDYVHRIGRTGRGGRSGKSITFFTGDGHEKALAGELAKVMRESGFDASPLKKFPMTIKKREHGVYGAFYRDDIPIDAKPQKLTFT